MAFIGDGTQTLKQSSTGSIKPSSTGNPNKYSQATASHSPNGLIAVLVSIWMDASIKSSFTPLPLNQNGS